MNYTDFVKTKVAMFVPSGLQPVDFDYPLMPHQDALAQWALRRGKAAIFADTGLGKTRMQLAWADQVHKHANVPVLILAPLAVAAQTVSEGADIGIKVTQIFNGDQSTSGIDICNYDRLHLIDATKYGAVVLDESSIIKHHNTKTLQHLLDAFKATPYKLCATATPAPNDWTELGTHAEFLGVCSRVEMLSEYFCHDGAETQVWRLKGHAKNAFWRWVSSWGAMLRRPSDLGFDNNAYDLPPLNVHEHTVHAEHSANGMLFAMEAQTLSERRDARRSSVDARVKDCAAMVNSQNEPWIVWCELNTESEMLTKAISGAVEVTGSMDTAKKEQALYDFAAGKIRVLVTKPSIAGFGLNWQHCRKMAFVGVTDSFESYYQAVRRCWRFGQKSAVDVHIFSSVLEGAVAANLKRKERDALEMAEQLAKETSEAVKASVLGLTRTFNAYEPELKIETPAWLREAA